MIKLSTGNDQIFKKDKKHVIKASRYASMVLHAYTAIYCNKIYDMSLSTIYDRLLEKNVLTSFKFLYLLNRIVAMQNYVF